ETVDGQVHRACSLYPVLKKRATDARRHEIVVARGGEDDFRRVREETRTFQEDALIQREDQRRTQAPEADHAVEQQESERQVEKRNAQQQQIERCQEHERIRAEHQQDKGEIDRQAQRGNEIKDDEVQ